GDRRFGLREEEVDARQQTVDLVARLRDGLADLARQRAGQRVELGQECAAKALDRREPLAQRRRGPGGLRRAGRSGLGGHRRGIVGRALVDDLASGRVVDRQRGHGVQASWSARVSRAARRKSRSSGASLKLSGSPGTWNSGCHCTAATYDGPVRRTASIMPSSGQQASTMKPGARSLIAWWWIEFTVACCTPG